MIRGRRKRKGDEEGCVLAVENKTERKREENGICNDKEGTEQQCPGTMRWRQARWLQGTEHPAKYGHQDPALSYFL